MEGDEEGGVTRELRKRGGTRGESRNGKGKERGVRQKGRTGQEENKDWGG